MRPRNSPYLPLSAPGDTRRAARRLAWERLARSLLSCVSSSHRRSSSGPNRSRGIFSPPSLLQAQQISSAQQAQGHVVMPILPRCGSRTHPGPRRSSPSRAPFLYATGSLPRMPGSPTEYPPDRWTGSSGLRRGPGVGPSPGGRPGLPRG